VNRLPDKLLCFSSQSNGIKNLKGKQLLKLIKKINEICGSVNKTDNQTTTTVEPSPEELKLAAVLTEQITTINSSTISSLGKQAVGLSQKQINSISDEDVKSSLKTFSKIEGLDEGQRNILVEKIFRSGYQVKDTQSLVAMGAIVIGIPSVKLQDVNQAVVLNSSKDPAFVT
uniref:Uncharacterized protein n=1 Tax=Latimeria chalumnae TaxID=7897 RepID=H3A3E9_LATCH